MQAVRAARLPFMPGVMTPSEVLVARGTSLVGAAAGELHADGALVTIMYFARGSAPSEPADGWGDTSCQALHYDEALLGP